MESISINMIFDFLKQVFVFNQESPLLFTQFYFWVFFAIVFAVFSLLHNKRVLRNTFLFFVSLFFYYKTSGLCLLILLFCTISDFFIAKRVHKTRSETKRKIWVGVSLSVNLLLLSFFKYSYFFIDLLNTIFNTHFTVFNIFSYVGNSIAGTATFSVDRIILPVGISFYIFQTISYTMDVYRKRIEPVRSIFDYGFYVSFFPQLVAGPIVRASAFVPQIYKKFYLSRRQFGVAVFWILNGLAKKIILSDYIAVNFIDRIFENPTMYSGFENLMALFGYSLQVYADFSGYTDIAIGVAMLMGFYLPKNFNSPYKATNAGNFWKRWHISLSKWLQDYLYIPLGGSRRASFGTYFWIIVIAAIAVMLSKSIWVFAIVALIALAIIVTFIFRPEKRLGISTKINLMNTMLLGGLWHGASLNFVIWGGLNGVGILTYKNWNKWQFKKRVIITAALFLIVYIVSLYYPAPVLNIAKVWIGIIALGTIVRYVVLLLEKNRPSLGTNFFTSERGMGVVWGILQTFVFISFTRLFFRSGSNLDPAEANKIAWQTATDMIGQIGGKWNLNLIPSMIWEYRNVFILIILGLIIHWLPERFKRWYRVNFAMLPMWVMTIIVVAVVFIVYQFVTSDLQAFIYFQF